MNINIIKNALDEMHEFLGHIQTRIGEAAFAEIWDTVEEAKQEINLSLGSVSGSNYDKFGEKIMLADPLIGSVNECGICKYKSNSDRKEPCSPCKLDTGEYYR